MLFLELLDEILICFWMLISRFLFNFVLCLWFFIFYDVYKQANFAVCAWFLGNGFFPTLVDVHMYD